MTIIEMLSKAKENPGTTYSCDSWKSPSGQNYLSCEEIREYVGFPQKEVVAVKPVIYYANSRFRQKDGSETQFSIQEKNNSLFSIDAIVDDWYEYEPASL